MSLSDKKCVPCEGGVEPLKAEDIAKHAKEIPGWQVVENHHLRRQFKFKNFKQALAFTNQVGEIAEAEQHHPELHLGFGHAEVEIWTHAIDGLHENDFILAAKVDQLPAE